MIRYQLKESRIGSRYTYSSPQFDGVEGKGRNAKEALGKFYIALENELNNMIREGMPIPTGVSDFGSMFRRSQSGFFILPMTMTFTVMLHNAMLEREVDRGTLARLLALDAKDVKDDEWKLAKIIDIVPSEAPKYKKVERLLDVSHNSTVLEIEEAFRLLDYHVDISLTQK